MKAPRSAWVFSLALFASLLAMGAGGCRGGVNHPPPGEPNDPDYCAERPPEENNCMACTSQPGCGWCNAPQSGLSSCQAGTEAKPSTCREGWAQSTEECEAPPPPPPPME